MPPIRIAFIGLSAASGWAKTAHLPYLQQTSKYQIVGVCNSSKQSGEEAIKAFSLPGSVKAYGSPEELADDSDSFDLAVCSVRVDKHYAAIRPAVQKGKMCYVEWPLGKNLKEAQDLHQLALDSGGAGTVVGLQARLSPVVNKVRELVSENAIGRVLSSTVVASAGNLGQVEAERMGRLFNDSSIQCTMLTIHFGHLIDYVLYALGQDLTALNGILSTQRKKVQLKRPDGTLYDDERNTPDQIMLQGHLASGALLSIHQRGGGPMKNAPGLTWRIYGEKGEIEVTSAGCFLQIGYDDMTIRMHDHKDDALKTVAWTPDDAFEKFQMPAKNVARLYEAFADGRRTEFADWEQAVSRHRLLEKIMESSEKQSMVLL